MSGLEHGDNVIVCARDEFFAFVDGWHGVVTGWNGGAVEVTCSRPDGFKTLYVPENQLTLDLSRRA